MAEEKQCLSCGLIRPVDTTCDGCKRAVCEACVEDGDWAALAVEAKCKNKCFSHDEQLELKTRAGNKQKKGSENECVCLDVVKFTRGNGSADGYTFCNRCIDGTIQDDIELLIVLARRCGFDSVEHARESLKGVSTLETRELSAKYNN